MKVAAKMICTLNEALANGARIALQAVTSGSTENETFFKYTPAGNVDLQIVSESAAAAFEVGKEYLLTFEEVN